MFVVGAPAGVVVAVALGVRVIVGGGVVRVALQVMLTVPLQNGLELVNCALPEANERETNVPCIDVPLTDTLKVLPVIAKFPVSVCDTVHPGSTNCVSICAIAPLEAEKEKGLPWEVVPLQFPSYVP